MKRISDIPPELIAETTSVVRAFVESLLLQMAEMQVRTQAEIDELKDHVRKLTPKNFSVPQSTQHLHSRPAGKPKPKSVKKRGGQNGHNRTLRELVPLERCAEVIPLLPQNADAVEWGSKGLMQNHFGIRSGTCRSLSRSSRKTKGTDSPAIAVAR